VQTHSCQENIPVLAKDLARIWVLLALASQEIPLLHVSCLGTGGVLRLVGS
jgi:hypothetical protein